ncbi:GOLPH3/VPS74 family protein [Streptomyces sirii]|uniref:GOLPH3/VPS74 family protein n=1 Tax=Streptomyces sirii TaxID=3127701 RepID=UPI003D36CCBF
MNNPRYLRYGLAGAALADLEATGRIAVERGDRVRVANPLPLGDPILDGALATLPAPAKGGRGVRAHRWVRGAGRPVQELCLRRLEERGALRRQTHRALGLFPYERFPAGAVDLTGPARARFKAAVEARLPDRRTRLLAAYSRRRVWTPSSCRAAPSAHSAAICDAWPRRSGQRTPRSAQSRTTRAPGAGLRADEGRRVRRVRRWPRRRS